MLGRVLYRKKSYAQALATLREVKSIDPEKATSLFLIMAYCALELGAKDVAKAHATDARKWAREDGERSSADQLIRYLEYKDAPEGAGQSAPIHAIEPISSVSEAPPPAELMLSARGRLVQMDCLDGVARLHVQDGEAIRKLLIRNPTAVTIRNTAAYTTEMTCGPQNTGINVEYTPSVDAKHQTVGDVRAIEFVK